MHSVSNGRRIPRRPNGFNPFLLIFLDFHDPSFLLFRFLLLPSLVLGLVCLLSLLILIEILLLNALVMMKLDSAIFRFIVPLFIRKELVYSIRFDQNLSLFLTYFLLLSYIRVFPFFTVLSFYIIFIQLSINLRLVIIIIKFKYM